MAVKHICFDNDGTLYAEQTLFKEKRLEVICTNLARYLSLPDHIARDQYMARYEKLGSNTEAIKSFGFTAEVARSWYNEYDISRHLSIDGHLAEMLRDLRHQGLSLSVFTNNTKSQLLKIFDKLGLKEKMFHPLLTAETVEPKPSEEGYNKVIQTVGCKPHEVLFVGDRMKADILPAKSVGMNTLLVRSNVSETAPDLEHKTYHCKRESVYEVPRVAELITVLWTRQYMDQ